MSGYVYLGQIPGTQKYKISFTRGNVQTHARGLGVVQIYSIHVNDPLTTKKTIQALLKPYHYAKQDYYFLASPQIGINAFNEYSSSVYTPHSKSVDNSDSKPQPASSKTSTLSARDVIAGVTVTFIILYLIINQIMYGGAKPSQNRNRQGVTQKGLVLAYLSPKLDSNRFVN